MAKRAEKFVVDVNSMTGAEIARVFGFTRQAVSGWVKQQGCPRGRNKRFCLPVVLEWWTERLEEDFALSPNGRSEALEDFRRARADLTRLELNIRRKKLVEIAHVEAEWTKLLLALKQRFLRLGASLAHQLEGQHARDIAQAIDEKVKSALNEMAAQCREWWGSGG